MEKSGWWIDRAANELHCGEHTFACSRDIEAMAVWGEHALLLSSDTDCLSLWDAGGLVRLTRVGVYPQDMAVWDGTAVVCGGCDGRLHLLELPGLHHRGELLLPGMPERIAVSGSTAHVLSLQTEPEVYTALQRVGLPDGPVHTALRLPGIPGAIATDGTGVWAGVSGRIVHLPAGSPAPDITIEGFELPERIVWQRGNLIITDALTERTVHLRS